MSSIGCPLCNGYLKNDGSFWKCVTPGCNAKFVNSKGEDMQVNFKRSDTAKVNIDIKQDHVLIKPLSEDFITPEYAHLGDAGMDLFSVEEKELSPGERYLFPCGFAMALPTGFEAQVRSRSGLAIKHGITVLNSPGTIDEQYRGEVKVILINHGYEKFFVNKGMKIAQMVFSTVTRINPKVVKELPDSTRGTSGFGSSGY